MTISSRSRLLHTDCFIDDPVPDVLTPLPVPIQYTDPIFSLLLRFRNESYRGNVTLTLVRRRLSRAMRNAPIAAIVATTTTISSL